MDPKTQKFFILSGTLLIGLVLYMMYRPKRRPSRLKLSQETSVGKGNLTEARPPEKAPDQKKVEGAVEKVLDSRRSGSKRTRRTSRTSSEHLDLSNEEDGAFSAAPRNLNIVFQFNGHSFDAYEVLGLPAGSGQTEVEQAYQKALSESEPDSQEFINLAYNSILRTLV